MNPPLPVLHHENDTYLRQHRLHPFLRLDSSKVLLLAFVLFPSCVSFVASACAHFSFFHFHSLFPPSTSFAEFFFVPTSLSPSPISICMLFIRHF